MNSEQTTGTPICPSEPFEAKKNDIVFLSFQPWEDLSVAMQGLVTECALASTTIFSSQRSDTTAKLVGGFQYRALAEDIPLEISPNVGWLQSLDSPVFVALDHFGEPGIISSALPCIWISTNDDLRNISQAVSLANRATKIFGSIALKNRLNISEHKFTDISSCSPKELALAILRFEDQAVLPDYILHEIPTAEIFGRKDSVASMLSSLDQLSVTRAARLSRFSEAQIAIDNNPIDDPLNLALAVLVNPKGFPLSLKETLISSDIPLPLKAALEIGMAENLKDLATLWDSLNQSDTSRAWGKSLSVIFLDRFAVLINYENASIEDFPSSILTLILNEIDSSQISQKILAELKKIDKLSTELLNTVRNEGAWDASVAAQLELWERGIETDAPRSIGPLNQAIATLDERSWHSGLWKTALALLHDEPTSQWDPSRPQPAPKPSQDLNQVLLTLISRLEQEAKSFAAQESYVEAISSFEQVRLLCGLTHPPTETTELSSRLNIYALSKKMCETDKKSFLFLSSTLDFLQPPADILGIRSRLVQLKSELEVTKKDLSNDETMAPQLFAIKKRVARFLSRWKMTRIFLRFIAQIVKRAQLRRVPK